VAYNGGPPPSLAAPAPAPAPPDLVTRPPEATGGETHTSPLRIVGIVSVVAAGAAAAGGTFALLSARSTFDDAKKNGCPGANSKTYCDSKANSVDSANTLSKIFFVGAGLLGVAGITMIVAAPSPTPDGRVSLAVSGRF
jgi:predicted ribosomally synthesized peptide with SipW-like signal peptide